MNFLGQFDCTMDDKGRIKMPATLRKQFSDGKQNKFMIARDIEECLVIYPFETWQQEEKRLLQLNTYSPQHRQFVSAMMVGLGEIEMDSADRFLVSKSLVKFLGNGKDVVLFGKFDRIQIWNADKFEQYITNNIARVEELAKEAATYIDGRNAEKK